MYHSFYAVPFEARYAGSFKLSIQYTYFLLNKCASTKDENQRSIEKYSRTTSTSAWILGKTDKPMYRPEDTIRFHFVALTNRQLLPTNSTQNWPKYRIEGGNWGDKSLEKIPEDVRLRRPQPPHFGTIDVKGTLCTLMQQWKMVDGLGASNL